ncbi:hypothetical protein B0H19DRAFT_1111651, partial [Mycena capillaripes]
AGIRQLTTLNSLCVLDLSLSLKIFRCLNLGGFKISWLACSHPSFSSRRFLSCSDIPKLYTPMHASQTHFFQVSFFRILFDPSLGHFHLQMKPNTLTPSRNSRTSSSISMSALGVFIRLTSRSQMSRHFAWFTLDLLDAVFPALLRHIFPSRLGVCWLYNTTTPGPKRCV